MVLSLSDFPGKYMYIQPTVQGEYARFVSRWYKPDAFKKGGACVNFWYHMYGGDIGSLNVYVRNIHPSGNVSVNYRHLCRDAQLAFSDTLVTIFTTTQHIFKSLSYGIFLYVHCHNDFF